MKSLGLVLLCLMVWQCAGRLEDLFIMDCGGRAHLYPENALLGTTVDYSMQRQNVDFWIDRYKDRVLCENPGLSDEEFEGYFLKQLPGGFLRQIATINAAPPTTFDPTLTAGWKQRWDAPNCSNVEDVTIRNCTSQVGLSDTCSYETWRQNQSCLFQIRIGTNSSLRLATHKCPNSYLPYVGVSCLGPACDRFLYPTTNDSECGPEMATFNFNHTLGLNNTKDYQKLIHDYLKLGTNSTLVEPDPTYLTEIWTRTMSLVRVYMPEGTPSPTPIPSLTLCIGSLKEGESLITVELQNCTAINNTCPDGKVNVTSSPFISEWDGHTGDLYEFDPKRLSGEAFMQGFPPPKTLRLRTETDPLVVPLLTMNCQGDVTIAPRGMNTTAGFRMNALANGVFDKLYSMLIAATIQEKVAKLGGTISDDAMLARFHPVMAILYNFSRENDRETMTDYGPDVEELKADWMEDSHKVGEYLFGNHTLPSTCTWDLFKATGRCAQTNSGTGMQLNMHLERCPNSNVTSAASLECIGSACRLFLENKLICETDADCMRGLKCFDLSGMKWDDALARYFITADPETLNPQCHGISKFTHENQMFATWLDDHIVNRSVQLPFKMCTDEAAWVIANASMNNATFLQGATEFSNMETFDLIGDSGLFGSAMCKGDPPPESYGNCLNAYWRLNGSFSDLRWEVHEDFWVEGAIDCRNQNCTMEIYEGGIYITETAILGGNLTLHLPRRDGSNLTQVEVLTAKNVTGNFANISIVTGDDCVSASATADYTGNIVTVFVSYTSTCTPSEEVVNPVPAEDKTTMYIIIGSVIGGVVVLGAAAALIGYLVVSNYRAKQSMLVHEKLKNKL